MNTQQWVGMGFAIALVIFAIVAFNRKGKLEAHQWQILRFLLALCAGFAGGLITGEALFKIVQKWGVQNEFAASGTAGFALFLTVWFTFRFVAGRPGDDFAFSLPEGWTFEAAASALARHDGSIVELSAFTPDEQNVQLNSAELRTGSVCLLYTSRCV